MSTRAQFGLRLGETNRNIVPTSFSAWGAKDVAYRAVLCTARAVFCRACCKRCHVSCLTLHATCSLFPLGGKRYRVVCSSLHGTCFPLHDLRQMLSPVC